MASIFSLVFILALSVSVGATTTNPSNTISDHLRSACKLTPEPETCLKYLSRFPQNSTESIYNITALSISAGSILAKEIQGFIWLLKLEASAVPGVTRCVTSSEGAISDIVLRFNDLAQAVRDRSFAAVSPWISQAWKDVKTIKQSCVGDNKIPNIPYLSNLTNDLGKLLKVISALFKLGPNQ